jgi:hypothetical protein
MKMDETYKKSTLLNKNYSRRVLVNYNLVDQNTANPLTARQ